MVSRRKLNVWVLTNEFHPNIVGGLGIVATYLTQRLSNIDLNMTVICSSGTKQRKVSHPTNSLHIIRLPKDAHYFNRAAKEYKANVVLKAAAAKNPRRPDLIQVHSTEFASAAAAAARKYRVPIVYTCHSIVTTGLASPSGRNQTKLIRLAKRIVVPSRWQAGQIQKKYPRIRRNITVIPHGVKRLSWKATGSPYKLLYVGRLIPSKGIKPLIQAVALLSRKNKKVRLTVVGKGTTRYQAHLRNLARQLGISHRIRWIKGSSNVAVQRMYASYGAVVVPSPIESFCLVALEAMANGVPLASTLSGGLKEFVNSRNAQIIPSVNSAAIARSISALWKNPARTRRRLINARSTSARYKWPVIAWRYKSLFMKLKR